MITDEVREELKKKCMDITEELLPYFTEAAIEEDVNRGLTIGGKYNWVNQEERLVYLGYNFSGNGFWYQFALVETPNKVWCEVLDESLQYFEESTD